MRIVDNASGVLTMEVARELLETSAHLIVASETNMAEFISRSV